MLPIELLQKEYVERMKSPYEIAREQGTYPNAVRRALKKAGILLRNHSEAQRAAITTGKTKVPVRRQRRCDG